GSSWLAAFLCFIILLTTAGNFLLILLIVTQRSLRNTSNYFLVSLFMSDLMVGLVVMPPAMLNQLYGRWVLQGGFCSLWYSFDVMCCSASILNLCLISLDRYLLIISPLKYKLRMTSCRALWLILATWTLAALASFLPIKMGWHELDFEAGSPKLLLSIAQLPSGAALLQALSPRGSQPLLLTELLQAPQQLWSLPWTLSSTSLSLLNWAAQHWPQSSSLTLGILLGMFFVAWLPFFVTNVTQAVCSCVPAGFFDVLTWLGYCNSTMNPIIYPLFMRDFKRAMGKFLPCCRRAGEPRPSAISLSMRNSNSGPRAATSLKNVL
ncbi:5-hydroxytryptamine receptor 6, partial [Dryobates pubescens]